MKRLMLEEQERLLTLIANLENELKYLPPGTFFTVKNGNYVKWFCYDKGKKIHIPKSDAAYASALARATFLRLQLKEAIRELEAVKAYLRNCIPDADTADAYMFSHEGLREMLLGNQTTDYIQNWINKPYQKNPKPYKGTLYKTQKGDLVKSLAEKEIADSLYLHNLPYRYECGFSFDNRTFFYPDL